MGIMSWGTGEDLMRENPITHQTETNVTFQVLYLPILPKKDFKCIRMKIYLRLEPTLYTAKNVKSTMRKKRD